MHWWRLPGCRVRDPKSRTEGRRKLKIGRYEVHDTGDACPHLKVKRSKVKVNTQLKAVTENLPYRQNGEGLRGYELQTW